MNASPHTPSEVAKAYALTSLFCLAIAILLTGMGLTEGFGTTLTISFCIGLSINTAFVLLSRRMSQLEKWYLGPILITAIGLSLGLILAGTLIVQSPWFFFSSNYSSLVAGIFFGVFGFLMFSTREELLKTRMELVESRATSMQQERRMFETELRLLQAQIEPHFLFNTLGNIASLIHSNPIAAEAMLQNLARLLRASLRRTRDSHSTLGEELEIISAYLDIQKVRMGQRLTVVIDVDPDLYGIALPPLLLQPLVENAVLHGLGPKLAPGSLTITVSRIDNQLLLRVTDDGVGFEQNSRGTGIGLRNIRDRLQALYGNGAALDLIERPEGGIIAELRLPLEQA